MELLGRPSESGLPTDPESLRPHGPVRQRASDPSPLLGSGSLAPREDHTQRGHRWPRRHCRHARERCTRSIPSPRSATLRGRRRATHQPRRRPYIIIVVVTYRADRDPRRRRRLRQRRESRRPASKLGSA
eukprot:5683916-Prymnesium_polylepis.1